MTSTREGRMTDITEEPKKLLRAALACLEHGELEGAAWRMADALFMVGACCQGEALGIDLYTGMGARLDAEHQGSLIDHSPA